MTMEKTIVDLEDYGTHGMEFHMDFNYECPLCGNCSVATVFCDEEKIERTVTDGEYSFQTYQQWQDFTITCDGCDGAFIAEGGNNFIEWEYKPKTYRKGW
jgi:hypothetical protein